MQADQRHLVLHRQLFRIDALAQACDIGRAAGKGEILAADNDLPAIDLGKPEHEVGRRERFQVAVVVQFGATGGLAHLTKTVLVDQRVDALADREAALVVLQRDRVVAALFCRQLAALVDFVDFTLPSHSSLPLRCI